MHVAQCTMHTLEHQRTPLTLLKVLWRVATIIFKLSSSSFGSHFHSAKCHIKNLHLANSMTLPQIETGPSDFRESADFCKYGDFLL